MPRGLADRGVQAALVFTAVAAAGLAALGLAWRGGAGTLAVYTQMPFLVSGAIGGVALAGAFLGLLAVHSERRSAALDRLRWEDAIASATAIAESLPAAMQARQAALERGRRRPTTRRGRSAPAAERG